LSDTVQLSVPAAVIELLEQLKPVSTGTPVPLRLTSVEDPVEELLERVREPDVAPAAAGSNCTVRVAVCPWVKVMGKDAPETVNPAPLTVAALTVNEAAPVEVSVTLCVTAVPTPSFPKLKLELLTLKVAA
jgi:hypothetical protein